MIQSLLLCLLGFGAGVLSGVIGIGGGIILVPALALLFKLSQHQAQGTTLALMVPPIGLLAAWTYYRNGYVDIRIAALVATGYFLGGLAGARFACWLSDVVLEKVFGAVLLVAALRMLLKA